MIPHQLSMLYVYLLKSQRNDKFYIGLTKDIVSRVKDHNEGKSYWTRRHAPFELVYFEAYRAFEDAKERERKLKYFKKGYYDLKKRLVHSISKVGGG
jgi:putative endonuclease